jgi:hypothetical protein
MMHAQHRDDASCVPDIQLSIFLAREQHNPPHGHPPPPTHQPNCRARGAQTRGCGGSCARQTSGCRLAQSSGNRTQHAHNPPRQAWLRVRPCGNKLAHEQRGAPGQACTCVLKAGLRCKAAATDARQGAGALVAHTHTHAHTHQRHTPRWDMRRHEPFMPSLRQMTPCLAFISAAACTSGGRHRQQQTLHHVRNDTARQSNHHTNPGQCGTHNDDTRCDERAAGAACMVLLHQP